MRITLGLVAENNEAYLNQVKLLLYSLRKNAGKLKNIPVTLVTNNEPLDKKNKEFLKKNFSPIEFKTMPRLGAIPHTSKLNVFYAIDPDSYDALLFMDCDTVIKKPLDKLISYLQEGGEFICRRGGTTDRNRFIDFDSMVSQYCGKGKKKILFEKEEEWPMFNTGVFLATSDSVKKIRKKSIEFTYQIFKEWKNNEVIESLPVLKYLYKYKVLRSKKKVLESWPIEQGGIALSCIEAGVKVIYLDEKYNSWGNIDFSVLHCFKSLYKFKRETMFTKESNEWIKEYKKSDIKGKIFLAKIVQEYKKEFLEIKK